jgi:hypothetical protein
MFRVLADHPHHTFAVDNLALITNFLYRCSDLHAVSLQILLPRRRDLPTGFVTPAAIESLGN